MVNMTVRYTAFADKDKLREAVSRSKSVRDAILFLGVNYSTQAITVFKRSCDVYGIDYSFPDPYRSITRLSDEQIFVKHSTYVNNGILLKNRAIKAGLLKYVCSLCGLGPEWNGQPLTLQLDHINGNNSDNRPENLRILCPNCHTQTPTFAGRRAPQVEERECVYENCANLFEVSTKSSKKFCSSTCSNREQARKRRQAHID